MGQDCWNSFLSERSTCQNPKKTKKPLSAQDFAGDGEPYSEIIVTVSIRLLGKGITRSRLAVNTHIDPALKPLALKSVKELKIDKYGMTENGFFGACLSENFDGWEDMDNAYPRIAEDETDTYRRECALAMNDYIMRSVDWAKQLHGQGMAEAMLNDTKSLGSTKIQ